MFPRKWCPECTFFGECKRERKGVEMIAEATRATGRTTSMEKENERTEEKMNVDIDFEEEGEEEEEENQHPFA